MLKISVKGIGDTERHRKRQNSIGGSLIAKAALGSSAVEKGIRVVQQGLHGRGRRNPGGAGLDGEHTLLVRQSDEGNGQPVTLGQSLRRLAGIRCGDPSLAGLTICWTAAGASAWASAKLRTASQTSAYDRARMRSRKTSFRGDSRSSPRRAMTSRYVVPLTNSVNNTRPVARTATKRWTCGSSPRFSVTASARTKVSAPRNPPQAIASL